MSETSKAFNVFTIATAIIVTRLCYLFIANQT
jgi:hypothetical protein